MLSVQVLKDAVLIAEASELGLLRRGSSSRIVDGGQTPDSYGDSHNWRSIGHSGGGTDPASRGVSHGEHFV